MDYAYLLSDHNWPPELHQVIGHDDFTELVKVSPISNPQRVLFVYPDDLWVMATI